VQLYELLHSRGFEILAFPCNQFGSQEKGTEAEIEEFVKTYKVTFPMFEKVNVNGPDAHPVWRFLKSQLGGVLGARACMRVATDRPPARAFQARPSSGTLQSSCAIRTACP
jgi:glutathione peroxidase-family protein